MRPDLLPLGEAAAQALGWFRLALACEFAAALGVLLFLLAGLAVPEKDR